MAKAVQAIYTVVPIKEIREDAHDVKGDGAVLLVINLTSPFD